jgi:hypothetical protein
MIRRELQVVSLDVCESLAAFGNTKLNVNDGIAVAISPFTTKTLTLFPLCSNQPGYATRTTRPLRDDARGRSRAQLHAVAGRATAGAGLVAVDPARVYSRTYEHRKLPDHSTRHRENFENFAASRSRFRRSPDRVTFVTLPAPNEKSLD